MKNLFYIGIIFFLGILSCNKYSESKLDGIWINETHQTAYSDDISHTWEFNKKTSKFSYVMYVCYTDSAGNCFDNETFSLTGDYSVRSSYIEIKPVQNIDVPNDTSLFYQLESDSLLLTGMWHHKQ